MPSSPCRPWPYAFFSSFALPRSFGAFALISVQSNLYGVVHIRDTELWLVYKTYNSCCLRVHLLCCHVVVCFLTHSWLCMLCLLCRRECASKRPTERMNGTHAKAIPFHYKSVVWHWIWCEQPCVYVWVFECMSVCIYCMNEWMNECVAWHLQVPLVNTYPFK